MEDIEIYWLNEEGEPELDMPIRTLPINWYVRGTSRERDIRLYYKRDQTEGAKLINVALGVEALGEEPELGAEVVSQGFFYMRLKGAQNWTQLTENKLLFIGNLEPGDYVDLQFKFEMPDEEVAPELQTIGYTCFRLVFTKGEAEITYNETAISDAVIYDTRIYDQPREMSECPHLDLIDWILVRPFIILKSDALIYEAAGLQFEGRD